jgi:hypothetical protein
MLEQVRELQGGQQAMQHQQQLARSLEKCLAAQCSAQGSRWLHALHVVGRVWA